MQLYNAGLFAALKASWSSSLRSRLNQRMEVAVRGDSPVEARAGWLDMDDMR